MQKQRRETMVDRFRFLRRLGIPGSAATVLSELSDGKKSTSEMSKHSGLSKSAISTGLNYWQKFGVASKCNTNQWQIHEVQHVHEMLAMTKETELHVEPHAEGTFTVPVISPPHPLSCIADCVGRPCVSPAQ